MTDHKFTDDQVIRCLNRCTGTGFIVANLVDGGKEEMITLQRLIDILNSQNAQIEHLTAEKERLNNLIQDLMKG